MARVERSGARGHLEAVFRAGATGGLTDRELLDRFVGRDQSSAEPAFATLVARHGPMVTGVCRRILNDPEDTADAFQATFLVLVRKAPSLRFEGSLGRWLHGVSRRIALQARRAASRRAAREISDVALPVVPGHDPVRAELRLILDEEITRLPDKYRTAVVLCDLEGLTHHAAARQLGCPPGTIESRLARGRQRLRDRLIRRGIAPSAMHLGAALGRPFVPPHAAGAVTRMAVDIATGRSLAGTVPASILALAAEFLRAAMMSDVKAIAMALALFAMAAMGLAVGDRARAGESGNRGPHAARAENQKAGAAHKIVLNGRTAYDPNTLVKVRPRFVTLVEKVRVDLGQLVKAGDPLVDLRSTDLAAAKSDFRSAFAQWQRDLKLRTLRETLAATEGVKQPLLNETRNNETKSRLAFATMKQKLAVLGVPEAEIDALIVSPPVPSKQVPGSAPSDPALLTRRSPIDGIVIQRDVVPGNLYDRNDVLMVLASLDRLPVWADLPQADMARVRVGQPCTVELPYRPALIPAGVDWIGPEQARDKPGVFKIRLMIPNVDGRLRADMLVRVRINPEP